MPRTSARSVALLLPVVVLLATVVVLLLAIRWSQRELEFSRTQVRVQEAAGRITMPGSDSQLLAAMSRAQRDLATFVQPSIVHIEAQSPQRDRRGALPVKTATGSGWIWDDTGHLVTAWHVVQGARRIDVQLRSGERRLARVVAGDPATDIAVLHISPERTIPATITAQDDLQPGDLVFAFGSPLDFRFSVTSGVVSGLGRDVQGQGPIGRIGYEDFIQIDAPINPGSSGGPITDHRGHIVGMSTAIAADTGATWGEDRFTGVALAIPMRLIESVVPQLIEEGSVARGFLGVTVLDRSSPISAMMHMRKNSAGLLIAAVAPDSPASATGLCPGDIITMVNGKRPTQTLAIPDGELELQLSPGSRTISLSGIHLSQGTELLGHDSPLRDYLDARDAPPGGVLVDSLVPGSAAERAGLIEGDLLLAINERPVNSVSQLRSTVSSIAPGVEVPIRIWRSACDKAAVFLEVQVILGQQIAATQ
jgi:S1-C subfamily serine protease